MGRIAKVFGSIEEIGAVMGSGCVGCLVWFYDIQDEKAIQDHV